MLEGAGCRNHDTNESGERVLGVVAGRSVQSCAKVQALQTGIFTSGWQRLCVSWLTEMKREYRVCMWMGMLNKSEVSLRPVRLSWRTDGRRSHAKRRRHLENLRERQSRDRMKCGERDIPRVQGNQSCGP